MHCVKCGPVVADDAAFSQNCGTPVAGNAQPRCAVEPQPKKSGNKVLGCVGIGVGAFVLLTFPTAAQAEPVNLSCFYIGIGHDKNLNQTIVLDEAKGTALYTDTGPPNPKPRLLPAAFQPNSVDITVYPQMHYLINRTTLDVRFIGGDNVVEMRGKCQLLNQAPARQF